MGLSRPRLATNVCTQRPSSPPVRPGHPAQTQATGVYARRDRSKVLAICNQGPDWDRAPHFGLLLSKRGPAPTTRISGPSRDVGHAWPVPWLGTTSAKTFAGNVFNDSVSHERTRREFASTPSPFRDKHS